MTYNASKERATKSRSERPGDHQLLDLVGSLADREDLRVAVEPADRILLDVAVAAMDLERLVGRVNGEPPALQLCLRREQAKVAALVLEPGGLLHKKPARLGFDRDVGELGLDRLEARDRSAEGVALLRVLERLVEC